MADQVEARDGSGEAAVSALLQNELRPAPASAGLAAAPDSTAAGSSRRDALRRAGEDYLMMAMAQAKKTGGAARDPFAPEPPPLSAAPPPPAPIARKRSGSARRRKQQAVDPDLAAFGALFESTKLYVYMGVYLVCQATIFANIKGSLAIMKTPGLMAFLHQSFAVLSFWIASYYDVFDTASLAAAPHTAIRGACVRAALFGAQMLLLYGALLHSSVNMVLAWACCVPLLADAGLAHALGRRSRLLSPELLPLLVAAGAATVLEILFDPAKSWLSFVLLLLWSGAKLGETAWRMAKEDPSFGGRLPGGDFGAWASFVRRTAEAEEGLEPATVALLSNALPALPVLVVGFIGQEGNELVNHELSVPAVTMMLLSCAAHVGTTWCQLLLSERLGSTAKAGLRWGALLGAVAFNFVEHTEGVTIATGICAIGAVAAAAGAAMQRYGGEGLGSVRQLSAFEGGAAGGGRAGVEEEEEDPEDGLGR